MIEGLSIKYPTAADAWTSLVQHLRMQEPVTSPRGMPIREFLNLHWTVEDARSNTFENRYRNLSYRFTVAEWLWIWYGHEDVKTIAQYNKNIAQFSDNAVTFFGAYGPRIRAQWGRVLTALMRDKDSRQAVIQIFLPLPDSSKDIPCTLSVQFLIRDGRLNTIVNMRSSDVWLGLPYDMFNFSMLGNIAAAELRIPQGWISFNLGSSHMYERNREAAGDALNAVTYPDEVPMTALYPWTGYANVLLAGGNLDATVHMRELAARAE
jgi:thymidylate synthase